MDHTAKRRTEKVTSANIRHLVRSNFFDKGYFENRGSDCKELWLTDIKTKSGTLPEISNSFIVDTEEEADKLLEAYPVGSIFRRGPEEDSPFFPGSRTWGDRIFNQPELWAFLLSARDDENLLAWQTLKDAGLTDGINITSKVIEFLGAPRIKGLQAAYGDNWQAVAEMEYCWYNLDASSSAYIAAQKQYHYFITKNDFAAGYLQRDLEILVQGVEESVERVNEFYEKQSKRSARGGEANSQKARLRRTRFYSLALKSAPQWVWKSQNEQKRFLKRLALKDDSQTGDSLFQVNNKPLSDQWFDQAITELRLSGELERAITKN